MELSLDELKSWLRVDEDDEDITTLAPLILMSKAQIKESTGLVWNDVKEDDEVSELYKVAQKIIISNLYENRTGPDKHSTYFISLCTMLEGYKLKLVNQSGELNG